MPSCRPFVISRLAPLAVLVVSCAPGPVAAPTLESTRPVASSPLPFPVANDTPRPGIELRDPDGRARLDLHAGTRFEVEVSGPVRRSAWSLRIAPRTAPVVVRVEVPPGAQVTQLAVDGRGATASSAVTGAERVARDQIRIDVPAGDRESTVVVGYREHVAGDEARVPAGILPPVPVTVALVVDGSSVSIESRAPHTDVVAASRPERGLVFAGDGGEGVFALPIARAARPEGNERVAILVDTSARAARFQGRALRWLEGVVRALPRDTETTIATFDHAPSVVAQGRAGDIDGRAVASVASRERLGIARWSRALRSVAVPEGRGVRIVVIGAEGGAPFDLTDAEADDLARDLAGRGVRRIDVIGLEGTRPDPWLASLVRTGSGGFVFDANEPTERSVAALFRAPAAPDAIGTTCRAVEPSRVDDVHASRRAIVLAHGCPASPAVTIAGRELQATVVGVARAPAIAPGASLVAAGPSSATSVTFSVGGGAAPAPKHATQVPAQTSWDPLVAFEDHRPAASVVIPDAPPPTPEPPPAPPTETIKVVGKLPPEIVQRIVRLNAGRFKGCYREALLKKRGARGSVVTSFRIGGDGNVTDARIVGGDFPLEWMRACVARSFGAINFPAPPDGVVDVRYGLAFDDGASGSPAPVRLAVPAPAAPGAPVGPSEPAAPARGVVLAVQEASEHDPAEGVSRAEALVAAAPESRLALALLGDAASIARRDALAERAYASAFSGNEVTPADLRTFGARLRALETDEARRLGTSALVRAAAVAPEETNGALLAALAYAADGDLPRAAELLEEAIATRAPAASAPATDDPTTAVLVDLYALVLSAWSVREPWRKSEHRSLLAALGTDLRTADALRVVATWEAPGDNVDLDVTDGAGSHAVPGHPVAQGGELRADDRTGAGVDVFGADGPAQGRLGPFRVQLRTGELRAPHVAGTVAIVERVGAKMAVTLHPFVVNVPSARADVTVIEGSRLAP